MVILLRNLAMPQLLRLLFFSMLHAFEDKLSLLLFCDVNDRSLHAPAEAPNHDIPLFSASPLKGFNYFEIIPKLHPSWASGMKTQGEAFTEYMLVELMVHSGHTCSAHHSVVLICTFIQKQSN